MAIRLSPNETRHQRPSNPGGLARIGHWSSGGWPEKQAEAKISEK